MKKVYCIYYREVKHVLSYHPTEEIKKWSYSGVKNEFFTKSDCTNYILDPENLKKFDKFNDYFVQEVFKKEEL